MGTQGQLTTQSGATVEGGPGLLDSVPDVPRDNVPKGVECWRVLSVHVHLLEPVILGEHVGDRDTVGAGVDWQRVLRVLLRLVRLLNLALLVKLLVNFVLDPSFTFLASISLQSA